MSSKLILIGTAMILAGCQTANTHIADEDPAFGESVRYNAAIQTINPAPIYPAEGAQPGDNGDKGAQAVKRYRAGNVKEIQPMDTQSGGPR